MANNDPRLGEQIGTSLANLQPTGIAAATPAPVAACDPSRPMMTEERRDEVLVRLAKVAGQVQGVSRMVGADRYCLDVLTQIAAAQKALDGVARIITRNYLERCVTDAITGGDPLIYDELMQVIDRRR
jgi:DNA-binding FrmR family transcriptional regulator